MSEAVSTAEKLSTFNEYWSPKIIGAFNGHDLMVVKVKGAFVWHDHPDTDDFFMVLKGTLRIDLPEGAVVLNEGDIYVVPKGVQHRPVAEEEAHLLVIEPAGTPNTGDPETAVVKEKI
ncbi:MAG: cupin domain-containing protein [Pseudomonadota bacterium]